MYNCTNSTRLVLATFPVLSVITITTFWTCTSRPTRPVSFRHMEWIQLTRTYRPHERFGRPVGPKAAAGGEEGGGGADADLGRLRGAAALPACGSRLSADNGNSPTSATGEQGGDGLYIIFCIVIILITRDQPINRKQFTGQGHLLWSIVPQAS